MGIKYKFIEPSNIIHTLKKSGLNSDEFLNSAENQEIKDELKVLTEDAVKLGLFGVPSFIVNDKLYFGQDE